MSYLDYLVEKYSWDGHCNARGLDIIKAFEGWSSTPYLCPAGIWTIGWGATKSLDGSPVAKDSPEISKTEGEALLRMELRHAERAIRLLVKVPLNQNQFSSMCSWTYNLGSSRLQSSTLRAKLNRGDYEGAGQEFLKWCMAGGRKLPGLVRRRKAERELWET